jgi:hypothetical protein
MAIAWREAQRKNTSIVYCLHCEKENFKCLRVVEMNEELATKLAAYLTLHLIPLNQEVTELLFQPEILVNKPFGGLTSLDHLHFSDVGYAIMANIAIESLNTELGLELPLVDIDSVVATDPFSPVNLMESGLNCP